MYLNVLTPSFPPRGFSYLPAAIMLAAATLALKLRQCMLNRCAPHGTLRLTGLHRREHARCIAILHRARQPRWWQLCPALAVIDPGPAAVLTEDRKSVV